LLARIENYILIFDLESHNKYGIATFCIETHISGSYFITGKTSNHSWIFYNDWLPKPPCHITNQSEYSITFHVHAMYYTRGKMATAKETTGKLYQRFLQNLDNLHTAN
jgi:hypothetical protein